MYNDSNTVKRFDFVIPANQPTLNPGFMGIDMYTLRMYPNNCRNTGYSNVLMYLYRNGKTYVNSKYILLLYDFENYGYIYSAFPAGNYTVRAKWQPNEVKDYTVRTYLPMVVNIT